MILSEFKASLFYNNNDFFIGQIVSPILGPCKGLTGCIDKIDTKNKSCKLTFGFEDYLNNITSTNENLDICSDFSLDNIKIIF